MANLGRSYEDNRTYPTSQNLQCQRILRRVDIASRTKGETARDEALDDFGNQFALLTMPPMRATITIPDDLFAAGERLATRLQISRSELFRRALAEFVGRNGDDELTASVNRALENVGADDDEFTRAAAKQVLKRVQW